MDKMHSGQINVLTALLEIQTISIVFQCLVFFCFDFSFQTAHRNNNKLRTN